MAPKTPAIAALLATLRIITLHGRVCVADALSKPCILVIGTDEHELVKKADPFE